MASNTSTPKPIFIALLVALFPGILFGQSASDKHDALIVYGKDLAFGVMEPLGWRADTGRVARQYQVNIAFLPVAQEDKNWSVMIRVRANDKQDENTIEDLKYDLDQYKKDYPACRFSELKVTHPEYKTFAQLVFVPKRFYEYVAYLNPGRGIRATFSVAMSKQGSPATEAPTHSRSGRRATMHSVTGNSVR